MSPDPSTRRQRPVTDLDPFELAPLAGPGAGAADLKRLAATLRESFALERLVDGSWRVVGCTGSRRRADAWVIEGGEPDHEDCP